MRERDWFTELFGRAITDIREKVVEEPWFGRPVTRQPLHPSPPGEPARAHADDTPASHERNAGRDIHGHGDDHEHGIDR